MKGERRHPVHPGEVLLEEFLKPMHLSQTASRWTSGCTRGASMRSCSGSGESQLRQHSG
jgi:hypothetical protein